MKLLTILALMFLCFPCQVYALQADEIVVIANDLYPDSVDLACYYMKVRNIPKQNLLKIATTKRIYVGRDKYESEIAAPVRKFLGQKAFVGKVRCLVTMRGVPLRIDPPRLTGKAKQQVEKLTAEKKLLQQQLKEQVKDQKDIIAGLKTQVSTLNQQIKTLKKKDFRAAVDSELALVLVKEYPLKGWVPNPFFVGFKGRKLPISKDDVLFVSRLDAPTLKIVRRVIDDSFTVENEGLKGTTYIDARWKKSPKKNLQGYAFYDDSLHKMAEYLRSRHFSVVLDSEQKLFQPGEAPDTALYCGWYSHHQYVDAFTWKRGAVGYHIASSECGTLRTGKSQVWCKRMLEEGAAAVIGPVGEPYVQAFPIPVMFFGYLTDGYYNLVESYFLSLPYLSWQMVLVGDPLYRPFKNRQQN